MVYASLFVLIVSVVASGYRAPERTNGVSNANAVVNTNSVNPSVDEVIAANIAATAAQTANLSIALNVAELATSTQIKSDFVQADDTSISKPQILPAGSDRREVINYTVKSGDTVSSIAAKFGLLKNTIKWSNDLVSDTISKGKVLKILPTNGVLYAVKSGDTLQSIGEKYRVDTTRVVLFNDLEGGLKVGQKIVLPGATLPSSERPGYVVETTFYTGYSSGFSSGRTWHIKTGTPNRGNYAYGNCTSYVYDRRVELGLPVGANWGNAGTWAMAARGASLRVDKSPSVGAIIQDWGHVAIVEDILPNGDLSLSEMNAFVSGGGYNQVSGRILPAANIGQYLFIH